jgi:membrane protein
VAAGVVFYGLLALFPAVTAVVSLYALIADASTVNAHIAFLGDFYLRSRLQSSRNRSYMFSRKAMSNLALH